MGNTISNALGRVSDPDSIWELTFQDTGQILRGPKQDMDYEYKKYKKNKKVTYRRSPIVYQLRRQ